MSGESSTPAEPVDPLHPSDEFLAAELEADRRGERGLVVKTAIALAIAAVLVVIRQLYFV